MNLPSDLVHSAGPPRHACHDLAVQFVQNSCLLLCYLA